MDTIIYIDGYNLFYGCLKHTSFKWLDLHKLFAEQIVPGDVSPKNKIIKPLRTPIPTCKKS